MPRIDRDFRVAEAERCVPVVALQPDVTPEMLASAWAAVAARLKLRDRHKVSRQELSVREHMTALLKRLQTEPFVTLEGLWNGTRRSTPRCPRMRARLSFVAPIPIRSC